MKISCQGESWDYITLILSIFLMYVNCLKIFRWSYHFKTLVYLLLNIIVYFTLWHTHINAHSRVQLIRWENEIRCTHPSIYTCIIVRYYQYFLFYFSIQNIQYWRGQVWRKVKPQGWEKSQFEFQLHRCCLESYRR